VNSSGTPFAPYAVDEPLELAIGAALPPAFLPGLTGA
jgi:hypothetical protein